MADVVLSAVTTVLNDLYGWDGPVELQPTRKDFEGDATLVVFPFLKLSRKSPVDTAREIGEALQAASPVGIQLQCGSRFFEYCAEFRPNSCPIRRHSKRGCLGHHARGSERPRGDGGIQ